MSARPVKRPSLGSLAIELFKAIRAVLVVLPFLLRTWLVPAVIKTAIGRALDFFKWPIVVLLAALLTETGMDRLFGWLEYKFIKEMIPPWLNKRPAARKPEEAEEEIRPTPH